MRLFNSFHRIFILYLFCFIIWDIYSVLCEELEISGKIDMVDSTLKDTRVFIAGTNSFVQLNSKGFFRINLPKGNHLLRIINPEFVFDTFEIQVFEEYTKNGNKLSCKKFVFDIESGLSKEKINGHLLNIKPLYSTKKNENSQDDLFSIFSLLKNPLVLISAISLGITFILPMLQDSLDAEAIEEITGSIPGSKFNSMPKKII